MAKKPLSLKIIDFIWTNRMHDSSNNVSEKNIIFWFIVIPIILLFINETLGIIYFLIYDVLGMIILWMAADTTIKYDDD